jgi:hypothetical protein
LPIRSRYAHLQEHVHTNNTPKPPKAPRCTISDDTFHRELLAQSRDLAPSFFGVPITPSEEYRPEGPHKEDYTMPRRIYAYAIVLNPTKKEADEGALPKVVVPPTWIETLVTEAEAKTLASRKIPNDMAVPGTLERVEVIVRPF